MEDFNTLNISIFLPSVVFKNVTTSTVGLLFTYYQSASLLPVRKRSKDDQVFVASPVVGASVAGMEQVYSLPESIILVIPLTMVGNLTIQVFLNIYTTLWAILFYSVVRRICQKLIIILWHVSHGTSLQQVKVTALFKHHLKHVKL